MTTATRRHATVQSVLADTAATHTHPTRQQQPLLQPFSTSTTNTTPSTSSIEQHLPYFQTLLQQLDAVGWDKVCLLDDADLQRVLLQLCDAAGRRHRAQVVLPAGFPIAAPSVTIQLPAPFRVRWLPGDSLASLVTQLEKVRAVVDNSGNRQCSCQYALLLNHECALFARL